MLKGLGQKPGLFHNLQPLIYLTPNTAGQTIRLTLNEGRQYYSTAFTHYLFILTREENTSVAGDELAQVLTVVSENDRITPWTGTTVGLNTPGRYRYEVYGQNSNSNIDPANAAVVGLVERGSCILTDATTYFTTPSITISDDIIAGQ